MRLTFDASDLIRLGATWERRSSAYRTKINDTFEGAGHALELAAVAELQDVTPVETGNLQRSASASLVWQGHDFIISLQEDAVNDAGDAYALDVIQGHGEIVPKNGKALYLKSLGIWRTRVRPVAPNPYPDRAVPGIETATRRIMQRFGADAQRIMVGAVVTR